MNRSPLEPFKTRIRKCIGMLLGKRQSHVPTDYQSIQLTSEEISTEAFKRHLGGGKEHWAQRGAFQLHFLRSMGLLPSSDLLDIGCGPLRAGAHLIDYLEPGRYTGFDCNADFITAAHAMVQKSGLADKRPQLACIADFDGSGRGWHADFALAFSVLNHCSEPQRRAFFRRIPAMLRPRARLYITHASWLRPDHVKSSGLEVTQTILSDFIDITCHGWEQRDDIFPIIELARIQ